MTKKDLVQELRELAKDEKSPTCSVWAHFAGLGMISCNRVDGCGECRGLALNVLADRIEAEYDPKPEPDTVEKVAKGLLGTLDAIDTQRMIPADMRDIIRAYTERLEALGVKLDD